MASLVQNEHLLAFVDIRCNPCHYAMRQAVPTFTKHSSPVMRLTAYTRSNPPFSAYDTKPTKTQTPYQARKARKA